MSIARYRYVLEASAFEAFIQLGEDEAGLLGSFFRWLAANPHAEGGGWHQDSSGRTNFASLCGPFIVVHWPDHAVREVRIVQIIRD